MASNLSEGWLYFMLSYTDGDSLFPVIDPMIYLGKNIDTEDPEDRWYFQDAESYALYGAYPRLLQSHADNREVELYTFRDIDLIHVKDFQEICAELQECKRRRKES